jgi:hypothetical protein
MSAGRYDFKIKQGNPFSKIMYYTDKDNNPLNLTGYKAKMQIRDKPSGKIYSTLTTENGKIIITPLEGKIELLIPMLETKTFEFCKAVYDLDIYTELNGEIDYIDTILEGIVVIEKEITKNVQ